MLKTYDMRILHMELILSIAKKKIPRIVLIILDILKNLFNFPVY